MGALFLLISFLLVRSSLAQIMALFLNIISIVLTLFPLVTIASVEISHRSNMESRDEILADLRGEACDLLILPSRQ